MKVWQVIYIPSEGENGEISSCKVYTKKEDAEDIVEKRGAGYEIFEMDVI